MALQISIGSITITINPKTQADSVVHTNTEVQTYAEFMEGVQASGLAASVFDAFRPVQEVNDPDKTRVPWPEKYGTTEEPYGTPADQATGIRAFPVTGQRWTSAIKAAAGSRRSFLEHYAEMAIAIATGIKRAFDDNFRTGRVLMPMYVGGFGTHAVRVDVPVREGAEVFIQANPGMGLTHTAHLLNVDPDGFDIAGDGSPSPYYVSWMVVG